MENSVYQTIQFTKLYSTLYPMYINIQKKKKRQIINGPAAGPAGLQLRLLLHLRPPRSRVKSVGHGRGELGVLQQGGGLHLVRGAPRLTEGQGGEGEGGKVNK